MSWKPLLDGAQRDAALVTVREIVAALNDRPPCSLLEDQSEENARVTNASLGLGDAGTAVGLGYLSLALPDEPGYAATARRLIADAAAILTQYKTRATLYGGFVGIAWALSRLRAWNVLDATDQSFAAVDKALAGYAERDNWAYAVELIYGAAGCLVYALSRLPNPDALRVIERGLQSVEASAEVTPEGLTWFIPPSELHSSTLQNAPEGCYNVGIGHGNPGLFSVLAEVHRLGIDPARSRRLLEGSVRWVLAQELPGGRFPALTGPAVQAKPARFAWCYGSPGIPIALIRAARALDREDWYDAALRLATIAAETPFEKSGVIDPPFCHGAVGLMHQFNRLHQETGIPLFADAARAWFERTLSYRVDGEGLAGFSARSLPGSGKYPEPGMLYGVAGIASAFAAAVSDVEPAWDAMFALSDAGTV